MTRTRASVVMVGMVVLLGGCDAAQVTGSAAGPAAGATSGPASGPASGPTSGPTSGPVGGPSAAPTLCAEFPPQPPLPGDVEGWWSSTPADANGNVLTDPADWPAQLREHPRTVVMDAATGRIVSSWDRRTCGPIPDFRPPSGLSGNQLVLLDADSGAVLETMSEPMPMPRQQ